MIISEHETQSADLIRLIQHVALNESGWWDQAIERLTLACAYLLGPSTQSTLCAKVTEVSGVQVNSQRLISAIERLFESGSIVIFDDKIQVTEETKLSLAHHKRETLAAEDQAYQRFIDLAQEHGLQDQIDKLWPVFETEFVLPIIRHIGAHIYGKISSNLSTSNVGIDSQINQFYARYGDEVRDLFASFMDPTDDSVRGFILRRLNARYVLDAAALPSDALDRIAELNTTPSRIDIFLDTNVLFYILGLDRNPNDDTALELLELTRQLKSRINLKLYVLPITVAEAKRVLHRVISDLEFFRGQSNLAEAARQVTQGNQGFTARFLEAQRTNVNLTAQEFFGPYESGLLTILREKSIELFNTDQVEALQADQQVIDDTHNETNQQRQYRVRGEKSHKVILHDMVLWHFVNRSRRSVASSSLLEISSWIVTMDYTGLLRFDKHKLQNKIDDLPICLDPASLIHMFQFWIPSSSELDEALVGSLRQPLLFLNFNTKSEQITIKILEQLSRYIDIEDLAPSTVVGILTNKALQGRISGSSSDLTEEPTSTLDLPIIIQGLDDKIKDTESQIQKEHSNYENERCLRDSAEKALSTEKESRLRSEKEKEKLASSLQKAELRLVSLEEVNKQNVQHIQKQNQIIAHKSENSRVILGVSLTSFISITVLFGIRIISSQWISNNVATWVLSLLFAMLLFLVGLEITTTGTRFANHPLFRWISKRRWWNYTITALLSIGGPFVTDWIRDII